MSSEEIKTIDSFNGLLLLDKKAGISSAQAISRIKRKITQISKIGHAGTLDPFATGLLMVLVGKATKLADYFQAGSKRYSGQIRFGLTTDSDDITGSPLVVSDIRPDLPSVQAVARSLIGKISQVPPQISAVHLGGKRAYQLKREGQEFELKPREVELYSLEIKQDSKDLFAFDLHCSKGFYVRSLARDLGQMLGAGACLESLRRQASEPFSVANALCEEQISSENLIPWDNALELLQFKELIVEEREFLALKNGLVPGSLERRMAAALDSDRDELLVYRRQSDRLAGGLLKLSSINRILAENKLLDSRLDSSGILSIAVNM